MQPKPFATKNAIGTQLSPTAYLNRDAASFGWWLAASRCPGRGGLRPLDPQSGDG
jgi:hypothetical protein